MRNQILTATSFFFAILLIACDTPVCKNENAIFNKYPSTSEEYKAELARQIKEANPDALTFTLNQYQKTADQEYLEVQVQGKELCATGHVLVTDWQKLADIRQTAGKGYRGAELKGLVLDIKEDAGATTLAYKDIAQVVD